MKPDLMNIFQRNKEEKVYEVRVDEYFADRGTRKCP